jgi:hypothetical protein
MLCSRPCTEAALSKFALAGRVAVATKRFADRDGTHQAGHPIENEKEGGGGGDGGGGVDVGRLVRMSAPVVFSEGRGGALGLSRSTTPTTSAEWRSSTPGSTANHAEVLDAQDGATWVGKDRPGRRSTGGTGAGRIGMFPGGTIGGDGSGGSGRGDDGLGHRANGHAHARAPRRSTQY